MKTFDHVVIGSGIAGLTYALKVAATGAAVAIVTKKSRADSNTAWAQGGIACVTSSEDSVALHVKDTLIAGDGLCHEEVVRTIVSEGPERIAELVELGMHFDERTAPGGHREPDLGREGAFQTPHSPCQGRHGTRDRKDPAGRRRLPSEHHRP